MRVLSTALLSTSTLCLPACSPAIQDASQDANQPVAQPASEPTEPFTRLSFGLYRTDRASSLHAKFKPIVEALERSMTARLGHRVEIPIRIHKTYDAGLDALVRGTVDFVRFGPASYVLACQREPGVNLLAMEQKKGGKRFKGLAC